MPAVGSQRRSARRRTRINSILFWLLAVCSIEVAGYALVRYFGIPPAVGHFSEHLRLLQVHAAAGAVALLTGPWQFLTKFRQKHFVWHHWLDRVYLVGVLVGSLASLTLAGVSQEGWATHAGFGLLALVWLGTGWMAFYAARAGHFAVHRQWSVRNFSLTFAAATLRMELPLLLFAGHFSFHAAYITVAWLSWIPNLIFAEWWLRHSARRWF